MLKHIENSAKIAIIATQKIQIDEEIGFDYTAGRGNVSKISDADERKKILKGLGFKKRQIHLNSDYDYRASSSSKLILSLILGSFLCLI